ncbi:MAG: YkgJ family cysteine cluster protein [Actinomycetota bacterium]|nr:YkgJ family cysteine cluster protein [Actinomycetota bacterium]
MGAHRFDPADVTVDDDSRDAGPLDAGTFSDWWHGMRSAIDGTADADVPCGTCTGCCEASQFIHLTPDDTDALAHIPAELRFPAPGLPRGHQLMGYDEHGRCPMLVDGACSIYDHRPRTCRTYDCRIFAATDVRPDGDPSGAIATRVDRWRFGVTSEADRDEQSAVLAAAAALGRPDGELPEALRTRSATRRAVLAVETAVVFLGPADEHGRRAVLDPSPESMAAVLERASTSPR